ncbi:hypothetical protein VTH82DRAFT_3075 [Thermothelomyces myriococcoides]
MALTTSMTRSRRAEGAHLSNAKVANSGGHRLLSNAKDHHYAPPPPPPPPRPKRQLDPSEREIDNVVAKKARFATGISVEIPARPSHHARIAKNAVTDAKHTPPKPAAAAAAPKAPTTHRAPPANNGTRPAAPTRTQQHQQQQQQPVPPKHREKVANGLKHELNRLQPSAADTKEQGRKLRSQEATRFKSELSAYFPEYDEVIGNDPKETHLLNVDTPIVIVPDPAPPRSSNNPDTNSSNNNNNNSLQRAQQRPLHPTQPSLLPHEYPIRSYADALYTDLFDAQRIDFSFLDKPPPAGGGGGGSSSDNGYNNDGSAGHAPESDPLPDALYTPAHKKAERLERSIRNTEKGRAQHEKDQIMRLLDGLQGHDWLRVMGVNGITESKKRAFEPARQHFIRGCENILSKFRRWAREEKRRRAEMLERRAAAHEHREGSAKDVASEAEGGEETEGNTEAEGHARKGTARGAGGSHGDEEEEGEEEGEEEEGEGEEEDDDDDEGGEDVVEGEPPDDDADSGDIDASVARQLREEALAAAAKKRKSGGGKASAASASAASGTRGSTAGARRRKTTTTTTKTTTAKTSRSKRPQQQQQQPVIIQEELPKPFTSFFAKPYERDAALSRNRRKGRRVLAWGQPVPDMAEAEFQLPSELCNEETLRAHARRRRRDKRLRK